MGEVEVEVKPKLCLGCNEVFTSSKLTGGDAKFYCSDKCKKDFDHYQESKRLEEDELENHCIHCDKHYKLKTSDAEDRRRFCSDSCEGEFDETKYSMSNNDGNEIEIGDEEGF